MSAFVFAGLPTTRTLMSPAALAAIASPCGLKMPPLASRRSARSMPLVRGRAPTSSATLAPSNAVAAASVTSRSASSGNAQSKSSSAVPSAAFTACGTSSSLRCTGVSGPSIWPEAMRKSSAYPIWPAAPVTVTVTGVFWAMVRFLPGFGRAMLCHHWRRVLGSGGSFRLATIAGIRVGVSASWFLILFLYIFWFQDQFTQILGDSTLGFTTAVLTSLGFFGSILLHELGHAFAARREGIAVSEIELFMFGGFTRMSRAAETPGQEFRIAAAGPAVTALIAAVGFAVGVGT